MTWPPPGFAQPCAQRGLRVLVHAGHSYIHAGDLAEWIRTQTDGAMPTVVQTAHMISDEVRRLGDEASVKFAEHRRDDQGELSAGGSVPRPSQAGPLNLLPSPRSLREPPLTKPGRRRALMDPLLPDLSLRGAVTLTTGRLGVGDHCRRLHRPRRGLTVGDTATELEGATGGKIEVIPGIGWRVKTTPRCNVEVWPMAFGSIRIVETYPGMKLGRGWCYAQGDEEAFLHLARVIRVALAWDGGEDTEPEGWIKEVRTGRRRPNGNPDREYIEP